MKPNAELLAWFSRFSLYAVISAAMLAGSLARAAGRSPILDTVTFGNSVSEKSHALEPEHSERITGGLGETAQRLLPLIPSAPDGGRLTFRLRCDPVLQNYFTLKLWGSDYGEELGRLYLFIQDPNDPAHVFKQLGYDHNGDIDPLNIAGFRPMFPGRFFYKTLPLPLSLTRGQNTVSVQIRATGPTFTYAETYDVWHKPLRSPTRGVYAGYSHTDGFFVPPATEKQGVAPANLPTRPAPGIHQALAGEKLPVPVMPEGVIFELGKENPYAGKADFYTLRYGPYLIGMNTTKNRSYTLQAPVEYKSPQELLSGKKVDARGPITVGPGSTRILYLN